MQRIPRCFSTDVLFTQIERIQMLNRYFIKRARPYSRSFIVVFESVDKLHPVTGLDEPIYY